MPAVHIHNMHTHMYVCTLTCTPMYVCMLTCTHIHTHCADCAMMCCPLPQVVGRMYGVCFPAGATVLQQGALPKPDDCMYFLEQGEAEVVISGAIDQQSKGQVRLRLCVRSIEPCSSQEGTRPQAGTGRGGSSRCLQWHPVLAAFQARQGAGSAFWQAAAGAHACP